MDSAVVFVKLSYDTYAECLRCPYIKKHSLHAIDSSFMSAEYMCCIFLFSCKKCFVIFRFPLVFETQVTFPAGTGVGDFTRDLVSGTGECCLITGCEETEMVVVCVQFQVAERCTFQSRVYAFFVGGIRVFGESAVIMGAEVFIVSAINDA